MPVLLGSAFKNSCNITFNPQVKDVSMYYLKGFCTIPSLVSNEPDTVSPIGEPSDYSLSFSRNKGYF